MNINCGDCFDFVILVSLFVFGCVVYVECEFLVGYEWCLFKFVVGDMNISIIKIVKGCSIMV